MEPDLELLSTLFPNLSAQLRIALFNLHMAATQLVPAAEREKDPDLDARAAQLDQNYYRLLRLVNSLSATAWFRQDKQVHLKNVVLVALVQQIFDSTDSLASLLGLELHLVCPKSEHRCALDPAALTQLLYQLLSNALKFTPAGGSVTLEVRFSTTQIQLLVSDTGCGISDETLKTLFTRCPISEELPPVPPQGLGLGLMLCYRIAEAMDGTLQAKSDVGQGSTFTLTLPNRLVNQIDVFDVAFSYDGGFNPALVNLADALPAEAFLIRSQF